MKHSLKYFLILSISLLPFIPLHSVAMTAHIPADTTHRELKVREVLTSQQLFMVKVSPIKGKRSKGKYFDFKAELRDAFMIICYDNDKTIKEQDWAMCPNGVCPKPGSYNWGTPEYKQLDALMAQAKKIGISFKMRLDSLRRVAKISNQKIR